MPSMEREVRRDLTDGAEKHAVDVFARNLRSLLLQPPIPKQVVLAIDPGFRTGCKLAVLDPGGNLLDQGVIYPHPPQNRRSDAKVLLKDLVAKYQVGVVAIGNGTACRETEELVAEIIAEGTLFSQNPEAAVAAMERAALHEQTAKPEKAAASADVASTSPPDPAAPAESPQPAPEPFTPPDPPEEPAAAIIPVEPQREARHHHPEPPEDGSVDNEAALANNDHPAGNAHPPSVAETPVGALPPISGGSPESSAPEAEIAAQPSAGSSDEVEASPVATECAATGPYRAGPGRSDRRADRADKTTRSPTKGSN